MRVSLLPRFLVLPFTVLFLLAVAGLLSVRTEPVRAQSVQTGHADAGPQGPGKHAYDVRFGAGAYLPSQATAEFAGFLKPEEIPSAAYCSHCHAAVHAQWRQSAHANSFRTPWYVKNVNELGASKGVAFTRHCEGCHNPAALFTGALTEASGVARPHDEDGVTCMVCHSIRSISSTSGTGSYVMGKPAVMVNGTGQPVAGLPSDAEILAHPQWHRDAVMRPVYRTSEFCAACHKAAIPGMMNGYKWLRTFSTYDEWQQSSWSTETPLTFYEKTAPSKCQACHMQAVAARDPAARAGLVASHRWVGANTAVPAQYGFDEQARQVVEFLRKDQLEVDIFGVTVDHAQPAPESSFAPGALVAPLGSRAFQIVPGDWVRVDVVVRNKGIGHTLAPELRDFFENWVDFQVKDDDGHMIYRSGAVDAEHKVDPEARSYTLRIVSSGGKSLDHHEVWKTYVKAYDATVAPGRSDVVRYRFRVPPGSQGFRVEASVRNRRFRRSFTDFVFGDKPTDPDRFPTVTLAAGSFHFTVGENAPLKQTQRLPDQTDLLRWNNYGIGMLDRMQFTEAVDAFTHVVALNARYEPGLVNVAIAEYSRGRYAAATAWLDRAALLNEHDSRAQYYRGLTLRWQNRYDAAIAVLEPVGQRYPRFRQVHQELGYLYMVQRRFAESREQYLAVQRVDPDDALAHRWLGPVYEALGDHAAALREAKLAAETGNDTAAGWIAQKFWRENLNVASEAMPGHTHSQDNQADDADVRRVLQLQNPPSYIWVEHF